MAPFLRLYFAPDGGFALSGLQGRAMQAQCGRAHNL